MTLSARPFLRLTVLFALLHASSVSSESSNSSPLPSLIVSTKPWKHHSSARADHHIIDDYSDADDEAYDDEHPHSSPSTSTASTTPSTSSIRYAFVYSFTEDAERSQQFQTRIERERRTLKIYALSSMSVMVLLALILIGLHCMKKKKKRYQGYGVTSNQSTK